MPGASSMPASRRVRRFRFGCAARANAGVSEAATPEGGGCQSRFRLQTHRLGAARASPGRTAADAGIDPPADDRSHSARGPLEAFEMVAESVRRRKSLQAQIATQSATDLRDLRALLGIAPATAQGVVENAHRVDDVVPHGAAPASPTVKEVEDSELELDARTTNENIVAV